jgi:hypothetical protein
MSRLSSTFLVTALATLALAACESFSSAPLDGGIDEQPITEGDAATGKPDALDGATTKDPCFLKAPAFVGLRDWNAPSFQAPGVLPIISSDGNSVVASIGALPKDGNSIVTIKEKLSANYALRFTFQASALPKNQFKLVELFDGKIWATIQTKNDAWFHIVKDDPTRSQSLLKTDVLTHSLEIRVRPVSRDATPAAMMTVQMDNAQTLQQEIDVAMTLQIGARYDGANNGAFASQVTITDISVWDCRP